MAEVVYLLSDVQGSTRLWAEHGDVMPQINAEHDRLVADEVARAGGEVVRERAEGDSAFAVFESASSAVAAAAAIQRTIGGHEWPPGLEVRIRMALHAGPVPAVGGHYGPVVNRGTALRALGTGGTVLVSDTVAAQLDDKVPEGLAVVALGEHRLPGTAEPAAVFALVGPGLAPPPDLDAVRGVSLPEPPALVGRVALVDEIAEAMELRRGVALLGPAGVGKTSLAAHVGRVKAAEWDAAAWWAEVPDGAVDDPGALEVAVADAVGVRAEPNRPLAQSITAQLRDGGGLLVLDRCEVAHTATAELVGTLLRAVPSLRVLVTSRANLGLDALVVQEVGPLAVDDALQLLDQRVGERTGRPVDDREAARELCRAVDSVPLAMELLAPRVADEGVEAVLDDTRERGAASVVGLDAALEAAYEHLDDEPRGVLRRLAVFSGGFTLEAAEQVVSADASTDVIANLEELVDRSLVSIDRHLGVRFRLLDAVQAFAAARLDERDEREAAEDAHLAWAFDALSQTTEMIRSTGQVALGLDHFVTEHDNYMASLDRGLARGRTMAVQLTEALAWYWAQRSLVREMVRYVRRARRATDLPTLGAMLSLHLASCVQALGERAEARRAYEDAAEQSRSVMESAPSDWGRLTLATSLTRLAAIHLEDADPARAETLLQEALELRTRAGSTEGVAATLLELGKVRLAQGDRPAASSCFDQARQTIVLDNGVLGVDLEAALAIQQLDPVEPARFEELAARAETLGIAAYQVDALIGGVEAAIVAGDAARAARLAAQLDGIAVESRGSREIRLALLQCWITGADASGVVRRVLTEEEIHSRGDRHLATAVAASLLQSGGRAQAAKAMVQTWRSSRAGTPVPPIERCLIGDDHAVGGAVDAESHRLALEELACL